MNGKSASQQQQQQPQQQQHRAETVQLELAFEYLMSKDSLQWIRIVSDQAILMSVCLQRMVDELLLKKQGKRFKKVGSAWQERGQMIYRTQLHKNHTDIFRSCSVTL